MKIVEGKGMDEQRNDIIEGRNAVQEALRAGRAIDKIYIARGETDRALGHIAGMARDRGITVSDCDRRKLDAMSVTKAHQGVIAVCAVREYASVDDIFKVAAERGEEPFVVVCDEISDPHNLGAIIRSAECAGAHGVIIPKHRSAGLTAIVGKTSAGAAEHMAVARVASIASALEELKSRGLWSLWRGGRGQLPHVGDGFLRPHCAGDRLRGRRSGQACARALRLSGEHTAQGQGKLPQRLHRGGGADVRDTQAKNKMSAAAPLRQLEGRFFCFCRRSQARIYKLPHFYALSFRRGMIYWYSYLCA